MVRHVAMRFPARCTLHPMTSVEAAPLVEDGSLDFVFVDAGHSYDAVKADIAHWAPKVRPGGWFGGHDLHDDHPGVGKAVVEAFGPDIHLEPYAVWWVRR